MQPKQIILSPHQLVLLECCLMYINSELERIYFNTYQKEIPNNPFLNTGGKYDFSRLKISAYNWDAESMKIHTPNLKYQSKYTNSPILKVYWYKHYRRGLYATIDNWQYYNDFCIYLSRMVMDSTKLMEQYLKEREFEQYAIYR